MKFLSKEKISNRRYKTPEGYLVCLDAIIARTGVQEYARSEIFHDSEDDTIIKLYRPENEVFSQQTIASFENKPFVDEHPNEDVNVDNYRDYSVGFVRDVRRANIDGEEVLIANLVVTDAEAIAEIESGEKNELSCGYDCDILGEEPNLYQANIRGNHVALCKAGRAGIARIQDSKIKDDVLVEGKTYTTKSGAKLKVKKVIAGYSEYDGTPFVEIHYDFVSASGKKSGSSKCYAGDFFEMMTNPKLTGDSVEDSIKDSKIKLTRRNAKDIFEDIEEDTHWYTSRYNCNFDLNDEYLIITGNRKDLEKIFKEYRLDDYNIKIQDSKVEDSVKDGYGILSSGQEAQLKKYCQRYEVDFKKAYKEVENLIKNKKYKSDSALEMVLEDISSGAYDSVKDAGTTRRMFRESEVGDEDSWFGTTDWGTPKGSMYIYKKNEKIIAEGSSSGWSGNALEKGEKKEFNSVKDLNKWLNTPIEDSIKDVRTLSISGWEYNDNDFSKELNEIKQLFNSNKINDSKNKLNKLLDVARDCLHQIDNATSRLNGERKEYYENIISQLMDLRKQHNLKDEKESMKDKLQNKPVKVRIKFESNQEANDALKMLCKKEQFTDCNLIFDDTIEVKTTDVYVDDLKKALKLYFVKKIEVKDSEELVEDGFVELEQNYVNEITRDFTKAGMKIKAKGKTWRGRTHFELISIDGDKDNNDLKYIANQIDRISDKFERYGYEMTYNVGLQQDGYISATVDIAKWIVTPEEKEELKNWKNRKDSIKDSKIEVDYDGTLQEAQKLARKYGCQVKQVGKFNGYPQMLFTGDKKKLKKLIKEYGMDEEDFEYFVEDSIKDTHFTVSSNTNSEEFNSEEELLKKYKKEGYDTVRGIKAPKLKGLMGPFFNGNGKILYETKERYMSYDSCKDEAIYMYIADPEDDKDIIYEAKHYGLKLENFGGLIKVIGTLTQIAKTLKMLPEDIIAHSKQPRSIVKKVKDVDTYEEVTEDLEKKSKKLDSVKVLKLIDITKKAKVVKDSVYKIKTFNNKWYYEETREDGHSDLVGPFKTSAEARAALQKHRPNVKVRHLESGTYYDDMELSAKTSEELDNLMKQYQKKHPTWKFGEIRKDKGLYRCSVIKDSVVKDSNLKQLILEFARLAEYTNRYSSFKYTTKETGEIGLEANKKINELYKLGLTVYSELKKEIEKKSKIPNDSKPYYDDQIDELLKLLYTGINSSKTSIFLQKNPKFELLLKKLNSLRDEYRKVSIRSRDSKNTNISIKDSDKLRQLSFQIFRIYSNLESTKEIRADTRNEKEMEKLEKFLNEFAKVVEQFYIQLDKEVNYLNKLTKVNYSNRNFKGSFEHEMSDILRKVDDLIKNVRNNPWYSEISARKKVYDLYEKIKPLIQTYNKIAYKLN